MKETDFIINNGILEEYRGNSREVIIPDGVTEIEFGVFENCNTIEKLIIPEGVVKIQGNAFRNCKNLREVSIPESLKMVGLSTFSETPWFTAQSRKTFLTAGHLLISVQSDETGIIVPEGIERIGNAAFELCSLQLEEVILPDTVTEIQENTFLECLKLRYVFLPEHLRYIGNHAFMDCKELKEIVLPENLETIGNLAFAHTGLTSISIPARTTEISANAFFDCVDLEKIEVSEQNPAYSAKNGILYDKSLTNVICCPPRAKDFTLPETVTIIGANAFSCCRNLTQFVVSESVTKIENNAFQACDNLKSITIPEGVAVGQWILHGCINLKEVRYHGIVFYPEKNGEIDRIFRMIDKRELNVKVAPQYHIVWQFFAQNPDDADILAFIKSNFTKMFRFLIDGNHVSIIRSVLDKTKFINKKNIDKFIIYAIDKRSLEIQVMLTHYKDEHIGYEDTETIIRKKFSL